MTDVNTYVASCESIVSPLPKLQQGGGLELDGQTRLCSCCTKPQFTDFTNVDVTCVQVDI